MPDHRWTRQGRTTYNTRSASYKGIRTPGGVMKLQSITKKSTGPKCSDCKTVLPGIKHLKATAYRRTSQRQRKVSRAYGGSCCHKCVQTRIVRAFLLEEQKAVKKVLAERSGAAKK
uniref:60S ribosomal protein L34 n=1 Tax=Amphora coffeiformis TaxID=265554 RepID=A0A6S8KH97_9STRA|mmetsp:Transcript_6225/g.12452  ORF Transcript_6225/g.12452 Transcript_6225/m.12452 type:complete len:116 (+) Transcript_6225:202-549(+)